MIYGMTNGKSRKGMVLSMLVAGIAWNVYPQTASHHPFSAVTWAGTEGDDVLTPANLWIFGIPSNPSRSLPFGGNGVRGIFDLRTISADTAKEMMRQYADLGVSMTMTLRWKLPHPEDQELFGMDNRDVPPTPEESAHAMTLIEDVITSEEAQLLKDHLYVQFYNEVGGGPGKAGVDDMPGLLEFATDATAIIRKKAPWVKICGPVVTMGQLVNQNYEDDPKLKDKATVIALAVDWTAKYADAQDIHFHGVDGTYAKQAISKIRSWLDEQNASNVELVAWEWSVARYPYPDDPEGVRNAIIGMWQAFAEGGIVNAAYGSYWPNFARQKAGLDDPFAWISVVDENGQPREPIYSTLIDIASGKIIIKQPDDDTEASDDEQSEESEQQNDTDNSKGIKITANSYMQWVDGSPNDAEAIEQSEAGGVLEEIDLRTASSRDLKQTVHAFANRNLGVAMTIRWSDPSDPDALDSPPSSRDSNRMMNRLRSALRSKDAQAVAENGLWVQFYDEIVGEHGRISSQDADAMFKFATDTAAKIRSSSPYVKIAGPALSHIELLSKATRTSEEQDQFDLLAHAVDWSIQYADAVNVHYDSTLSASQLASMMQQVRAFIDTRPGGANFPIVDWNSMPVASSTASIATASQPAESKAQLNKRMNTFKKDYKNQLKEQYRASGEKKWQKKWNADWKSTWGSEWEKHESGNSKQ